ncbi:spore wall synthesis complex protein [Streptomonospora sediminis]
MPLSEHEQRMLDQIEQALYAEDPKFANTVRQTTPAIHYKRSIVQASIGFVVGISLLMGGAIFQQVIVGVIGFIVMLACLLWGLSAWRRVATGGGGEAAAQQPHEQGKGAEPKQRRRQQRPGMMHRFEERWRRRQEGDDK